MAELARVTSLDALEAFRAQLIVFITEGRRSVDEARGAVRQTRQWLENEQRTYWESEIRKRRRALDQAEAELFNARLSKFGADKSRQQLLVRRAREAMATAEEKLRNVKKWRANFDSAADPLAKRLESLRSTLDFELPKGVAFLQQAQITLEAYAQSAPMHKAPSTVPATPAAPPQP